MPATSSSKPASEFPDLIEALQKAPEQERNDRKKVLEKIARRLNLDQTPWETKEDTVWLVAYVMKSNPDFVEKEEKELILPPEEKERVLKAWGKFKEAIEEVPREYIEEQVQPLHQTRREYRELLKQFEQIEIEIEGQVTKEERSDAEALGEIVLKAISESTEVKQGEAHTGWRTIKRDDLPNNILSAISRQAGEIINYKRTGQIELPHGVHIKVNGRQQRIVKYGDTLNIPVFPRPKKDEKPPAKGMINVKVGVSQQERDRRTKEFIEKNQRQSQQLEQSQKKVEAKKTPIETGFRLTARADDEDGKASRSAQIRNEGSVPFAIKGEKGTYEIYIANLYKIDAWDEAVKKQEFKKKLAFELALKITKLNKKTHPDNFNRIAEAMCTPDYRGHPESYRDKREEEMLNELLPLVQQELQILKEAMKSEIDRLATLNYTHEWEGSELYGVPNEKQLSKTQRAWYQEGVFSIGLPPKDSRNNQVRLRGLNIGDIEKAMQINERLTLEILAKEIVRIISNNTENLPGSLGKIEKLKEWVENSAFKYTFHVAPILSPQHKMLLEKLKEETVHQIVIENYRYVRGMQTRTSQRRNASTRN